jgi:hypothetical protein
MRQINMLRMGLVVLSAAVGGCGSSNDSNGSDGGNGSSGGDYSGDAGAGDEGPNGSSDSAAAPTALVRVAHLSPDAPAVDFCVAPHGTSSFLGPVLSGAGAAAGLAYSTVTKYLPVPAAQLDVRIVAPGSSSCATSLAGLPDFTGLPALPAGAYVTIAAEGLVSSAGGAASPFGLAAYIDDSTVASGQAALRFIHASPGTPAVDVGLGGGVLFTSVFTDVAFGEIATMGTGERGYQVTAPLNSALISARAHGTTTDVLSISQASLPAGAIATAFAIGEIGNASSPLKVLLCVDNAPPSGLLSRCTVVGAAPALAHVRVAHLSPDAPAVDVCIAPAGTSAFAGPLLASLGATAGLSYPQVTVRVDLPEGAYDVRIAAAPAANCNKGVVPDTTGVTVTGGLSATVAAIGDLTVAGSDPTFHLAVFADDTTVASGDEALRFIHAAPSIPPVDVGLGSGQSFTPVFSDVAFGHAATAGGAIDESGFYVGAPLASQTLSARANGTKTNAIVLTGVDVPAGSIVSAFAIGAKTGATTNPLSVLLCDDTAAASGLLTTCTVKQ